VGAWGHGQIKNPGNRGRLSRIRAAQGESEVWNIQISDKVTAPVIRQTIKRGHGNM